MDHFSYQNGQLYCENVNVNDLAMKVDTPFFLYSKATFKDHFARFSNAFRELNPLVCYSIKNCGNIHLINLLVQCGSGIDVVSGGELFRALKGGVDPAKVVFAGVGKTSAEIRQAFEAKVGWLNVESEEEFENARAIAAEMQCEAKVALRINPNVYDPETHDKCATGKKDSKFGVDIARAKHFFETYSNDPFLKLRGLHIHMGSPIYTSEPYIKGITKILSLIEELEKVGHKIEMIDIGGGFIAHYDGQEKVLNWDEYASDIVPLLQPFVAGGGQVILEPGRSISANAGVLISRVLYKKVGVEKKFVILDTGMGHFIRPSFYDAYHFIWPTKVSREFVPKNRRSDLGVYGLETYDIVGPYCESSDYLAHDRNIPLVHQGDLMCIYTTGAYSMSMSSQYNGRPRPPEVLVDIQTAEIIRKRENYEDLINCELETNKIDLS
jgi:diaminopimelate decarboxylase